MYSMSHALVALEHAHMHTHVKFRHAHMHTHVKFRHTPHSTCSCQTRHQVSGKRKKWHRITAKISQKNLWCRTIDIVRHYLVVKATLGRTIILLANISGASLSFGFCLLANISGARGGGGGPREQLFLSYDVPTIFFNFSKHSPATLYITTQCMSR